jgi:phospholipid/cholesterol/gamma-HCH transport system ATP-binding protein
MSDSVLEFQDVCLTFEGKPALEKINLKIHPGETYVILGAAGSGKTVLLKLAMGLIQPTSGKIFLLGNEITGKKEVQLFDIRSQVGILFQEGGLFDSLNIEENVAYPLENQPSLRTSPEQVHSRVQEALDFVELGKTLKKFPSELSGGMRRRVGIARANVTLPKLLLYDSPTAGLDPITAHTIMTLIIKQRDVRNTTTLLVTHRYQDGAMAANFRWDPASSEVVRAAPIGDYADLKTTFLVMEDGKVAFQGSQAELEACTDTYVSQFVLRQPPMKT